MTTRAQIEETLIQWARENVPASVAPAVLFVEDPELEIGRVAITIRVGRKVPTSEHNARSLPATAPELLARFDEEKPPTPQESRVSEEGKRGMREAAELPEAARYEAESE